MFSLHKLEKTPVTIIALAHASKSRLIHTLLIVLVTGAVSTAQCANAQPRDRARPLRDLCSEFALGKLPHNAKITKTELREASGSLTEACIVRGTIVSSPASTITWAVELPAPAMWNGKTLTIGGGGFDGFIPTDSVFARTNSPSYSGYVRMSSNSGHDTPTFFPWALDDVALQNHGFDANHFTRDVGVRIATEFYGWEPSRSYMIGGSNGGRAGIISMQKYPQDYDGIIAHVPAVRQQAHQANLTRTMRHIFGSPENWLSPAKLDLFARTEIKACDGLDGLEDGVISNVEACRYIPTDLLCKKGVDNDGCLTAGQIESIRMIYSDQALPIEMEDGLVGYPRFGRGGAATGDWSGNFFGSSFEARESFNYMAISQAAKVVENNPNAEAMTHEPTNFKAQYKRLSSYIDLTDPDLSAFADNGGKLLVLYGLADACVSVYSFAKTFDLIKQHTGEAKVEQFARFLTAPGTGHGLDGPGAGRVDLLSALDTWVEHGVAPDHLVASKWTDNESRLAFQRPLCEFPKFPRYKGEGSPTKAESFFCTEE